MSLIEYQSCTALQVDGQPETYCCSGCISDAIDGYDSMTEHYANEPGVPWLEQVVIGTSCCRHHEAMVLRIEQLQGQVR